MPRNITTAQNCAPDFYESDSLAQTNQIKYDCFWHRKHKKIIFSRSKSRHVFLDVILYFIELELLKEIFLSPEYPNFRSKF